MSLFGLEKQISSAKQLSELSTSMEATQEIVAKSNTIKFKGAEAQIESRKILAEQRDALEVMRATINALLKHNLEQAKLQEEREKIMADRHREIMLFAKIAALASVIGLIYQIFSSWKS